MIELAISKQAIDWDENKCIVKNADKFRVNKSYMQQQIIVYIILERNLVKRIHVHAKN